MFLFLLQCLENLILPPGPHIFGILIQREEVSWVQLFPIRLILRLGAEYKCKWLHTEHFKGILYVYFKRSSYHVCVEIDYNGNDNE